MVLQGINYSDIFPIEQFQIAIRTGETIKPGTYKSTDGNVGFICAGDSYHSNYYIDDSLGDMTVNIESFDGNIIHGSFSGTDVHSEKIQKEVLPVKLKIMLPRQYRNTGGA